MSEAENTNNCALDELMNYVNSLATQSNASYTGSQQATMLENETEDYKNWALDELMNYLDSWAESSYIPADMDKFNSDRNCVAVEQVEVLTVSKSKPQDTDSKRVCSQDEAKTARQVTALSPSYMANLVAMIQGLQSSNGDLTKRVNDLQQALAEFYKTLESYKAQTQVAEAKLMEKERALATACQTIECQQNLIESLSAEIASHKEFVAQSQAMYKEQSHQLLEAKNSCRDLNTRLHREQQKKLQLKFALEKRLETPAIDHQYLTHQADLEVDFNVSKAMPIKTWSIKKPCSDREIELDWERPQPETNLVNEATVVEAQEPETSQEHTFTSAELPSDYENEIIEVQWQELANFVENNLQNEAIADLTADILAELDESPNLDSPLETSHFKASKNWPSPVVYPSRPPKGRKSLAAIELPAFRRRA